MSLSKIGKLTSAFSSFKNNPLDLTNMATALASVGNVDNAAKYLVKINKQNGNFLGENAMAVLLSNAYRSSGVNQEMAMGSINNALANSSKFSIGGMLGSLSAVGTGIATMFESIAPVIIPLIIAAVAAKAGKMAWDNFATNTAAKKQYQTSSKAYQEAASERDSVQSEYDSNKERIQELRAKANRTVDESKELSNLQSQNDLLNSQLSVKNQIADTAQKQAALDAKTALEKGSYRSGGLLNMDYDSDLEHASQLIKEIKEAQSEKAEIEANRSSYDDSYWSDYQKEERDIAKYDKDITNKKSDLSDLMTTISDTSQDFWDEQGNLVDKSTKDTADKVKKLANDYTSITGVSDIDSKMNNLFARSQFKDVKDQLLDIGKKQGSKGIETKIDEIDGLKFALDDAGISVDDFTSELMAMADPDAKNLEGIKENLKDIFGEIKDADGNSLYDFFKDKSNKDIEGYYDYFLNQGLNPQTSDYTWKKEDIENSYNDYLKSKETIEAESSTFSSKFKNSAEDTATDLDTITDNFQTDMSNIKSSMDSIKSGTFQNSDITDLIQQFPELATETDNLQQGLQNLAFDKASDAIGKIRDSVKDVTDPKQLAAADKYVQSIMDTMNLSGFDMSNAKSEILGNLTKNLADKHMASVTTPNLVNQLMSEYGNDEVAVQAIMKLSLDPSMANADLDTWKSKIEDTKVQIQLDTSAKNLDSLSKELTRLQTDASDQQTRLNNKSAYNMKATASDYTNLIENGDKQIENLNNQIQEYQNSIDALKNSKGISPLSDEDNEQIKQWQDQIQASQMSIENMKASQADWTKTAFNLPVTDMQNTVTALTSAISEMQTETGLTSDTMDSLRTQFSDLKDAHVDNVFDRTAKGLKINTERMKDYLEQQNEFMNSDFAQRIQDYQDQLSAGNKDYTQQGLENLKNLQAQYFAQYQEAAKQFSDFQTMVNADNLSTEGNEYTTAKSYLDNAKDLYDKGLVGTPQFKAAAKYFSQNGFEDADNFIENYNKLKNYYTDDASGPKRFLSDLEAKGLATYKTLEDGNQQWMYSFTDTQEAADAMGMSLESFESMFGRLKDYGDTNNFVSSLEEGALKSEEIDDKLIDAQIKMGKLKASGANQSALDDQQAVIDNLIAQKTGITQAISDFKDGTVDRKIQDIKDAKGSIDELNQYIKDNSIDKDSDLGKKYIESIQEQANKAGIKLTPEFEVDEAAYNEMIQSYEAKAKGSQIKHFQDVNEGIESGNTGDYSDSDVELVNKIKDAQEQKSEALQNVIDTVNSLDKDQWNEANQIELGNGAYESEDQGIRNVEDALQGLSDQFGLTEEQATALLPALEALGVVNIDPNVDMTGLDELDQATQDGMASLRQMQADGNIKLSFDVDSSTEGLSVDKLQSQISELEHIKVNFDVDSSEYKAIQSMIDQREMQMHVQIAVDKTGDIDKLLSLNDEELAKKAELDVDVNTEEGKAKIDELRSSLESLSGDTPAISVKIDETQFQALTKEQQGQGTVTFKPEHSEVDAYLAEEKKSEGKVKWSNETGLVDAYAATEHYSHGTVHWGNDISAVQTSFTATGTVNWINSGGPSGGLSKTVSCSTGTFRAESTGSAYNVLNITPAHASGTNVAIKQDQQALVNEVGVNGHAESIVRDGVWSLIPGGAHIENLKKGDIIFSATQTDALLKHGAIQGHARAYASGTVTSPGVMKAYAAGNTPGFHFQGGATTVKPAGKSGNSGDSGSAQLSHSMDKLDKTINKTSSDVSKALDDVIKALNTNVADWAEIRIARRNTLTEDYQRNAESDYTSYKKSNKNYYRTIQSTKKEIEYQKQSKKKYLQYADKVAAQVGLSEALKKKVQKGTIDIQQLSEADKKRVDAYSQWYDKYLAADKEIKEKNETLKDLGNARVDNVYERYDAIADRYASQQEYYQALRDNRVAKGQSQYVKIGKNDKYANSVWYQQMQKESSSARKELSIKKEELKQVQSNMKKYLAMQGTSKYDTAYQKMVKEAIDLKTVIVNLDTNIQKLDQSMQDAREQLLQWRADRWDRAGSKQDAVIDYAKANDNPNYQVNEKLYQERIKTNSRQIVALQKLKQDMAEYYDAHFESYNNEEAQKYLDNMAQIDEQILKLGSDTESLKNEIMELRWKPFEDYQDKLSSVINEYQTAQKLLGDSDSFYNDDGTFTENGLTNILLTQEQIDATKDKIANYRAALDKLDEQYKNGCYSKEEYQQKSEELLKSLQQESSALSSLRQNMLDMYETQVKKENDLLQENIDKRKDALSAKEKYYDYDKTLKKKSKDINTLKAQIAALEGTSNAAAKARLEKLRAELSDAEDDMADTMHQHEVDMKNTGYENFSNEANKALDNTLDAVKKNSAFQEAIIGNMLSNVKTNYDSTYKHLHDVMDQYGLKVSQTYDQMIGKAADFNTAAVNATKAWEGIANIKVNLPAGTSNGNGGSTTGGGDYNKSENILHNNYNDNKTSNSAGNQTNLDGKNYTLTLNEKKIYLTKSHKSQTLKATWKPSVPQHNQMIWTSSNTSVAKVDSKGKVTATSFDKSKCCTITVTNDIGSATAKCKVYVVEASVDEGISVTETLTGKTLTESQKHETYEYAANNSIYDGVTAGKKGATTALLNSWFNKLPNRPEGTKNIPEGTSKLAAYFMKKGKKVNRNNLQELADILFITTPGAAKYEQWDSSLKNRILEKYKSYGFSKGGVVRRGIPASILDMIGADALIPRGDSTLIGANPGETVLTKEFTDQLKPTVATLNEFNARMAKPITPILPSSSNDTNVNSECNITINVDKINNEQDIKKLAYQIGDIITERNKRDWKKVR